MATDPFIGQNRDLVVITLMTGEQSLPMSRDILIFLGHATIIDIEIAILHVIRLDVADFAMITFNTRKLSPYLIEILEILQNARFRAEIGSVD